MLQGEIIWGAAVLRGCQGKYKKKLTEGIHTQKDVRGIVEGRLKKEAEKRREQAVNEVSESSVKCRNRLCLITICLSRYVFCPLVSFTTCPYRSIIPENCRYFVTAEASYKLILSNQTCQDFFTVCVYYNSFTEQTSLKMVGSGYYWRG